MMIAVLAFLIDTVIGDPNSRLHPVALIGKFISFLEYLLYPEKAGSTKKRNELSYQCNRVKPGI